MRAFFEGARPGRIVTTDAGTFELPVLYFRDDSFGAVFSADLEALRAAMPSDQLHPVQLRRGRGLVYIAALDYLETSVSPYGELAVVVPAVHGKRPPPVLPSVFESSWPGFGGVILHLPVTHRLARDAGRLLWGYPKFIASMQFSSTPELHECRLEEGGMHILTLRVVKRGVAFADRRPLITYSVKDGALIRTTIPQSALVRMAFGAGGSSLVLGDQHPVAMSLRSLGIAPQPVMTRYFTDRCAILPEGEVVETGVRPLDGYLGSNLDGDLATTHPVSATIH